MVYANSADPDQKKHLPKQQNLGQHSMEYSVWKFMTFVVSDIIPVLQLW